MLSLLLFVEFVVLGSTGNHLSILLSQISRPVLYIRSKLLLSFLIQALCGAYVDTRSGFFRKVVPWDLFPVNSPLEREN